MDRIDRRAKDMKVFKHYGEEIQMEYGPVDGIVSRAVVDYFKAQGYTSAYCQCC